MTMGIRRKKPDLQLYLLVNSLPAIKGQFLQFFVEFDLIFDQIGVFRKSNYVKKPGYTVARCNKALGHA